MARFRFSHRAEADLFEIGIYTLRTWGEIQTDRYIRQLEDCCQLLADNSALGRQCDEIRPGVAAYEAGQACCLLPAGTRRHSDFSYPASEHATRNQAIDDEDDTPDSL